MELEELGKRFVTLGPTHDLLINNDGGYSWAANGIRAKENIKSDLLAKVECMIDGTIENVDHFAIQAGSDFELSHNKTSKKLRFICLKGAVENNHIRWWKIARNFAVTVKA